MRRTTTLSLLGLAAATYSMASSAVASTNVVWLLNHPAHTQASSDHVNMLNLTLAANAILFHTKDGSVLANYSLTDPSQQDVRFSLPHLQLPAGATNYFASDFGASSSTSQGQDQAWHVVLQPAEARKLALKGKGRAIQADAEPEMRWLVQAQSSGQGASLAIPLLEVAAYYQTKNVPCNVAYTAQPVAHHLTLSPGGGIGSSWHSHQIADWMEKAWLRMWKLTTRVGLAMKHSSSVLAAQATLDASVRVLGRTQDGSYRPLQDLNWLSQPNKWRWNMLPTVMHLPNIGADKMRSGCGKVIKSIKHPDFVKAHSSNIFSFPRPSTLMTQGKAAVSHHHLPKTPKVIVRPVKAASDLLGSIFHILATQWKEADGPKQTFMAVIAILQIVWLACTIKGWLDRLFGRGSYYRNQRTKKFARRAAIAAAGGSGRSGKPLLPPRPSAGHPLSSPMSEKRGMQLVSNGTNELITTLTGEIVLPSWTETGPTTLMVIVEEPELEKFQDEEAHRQSAHEKKRSDWDRMAGEWDDGFDSDATRSSAEQGWSSSNTGPGDKWMSRLSCQSDGGSLRYRERREGASLPSFHDDRQSLSMLTTPQMESLVSNRSSMEGRFDPESYWQQSDATDMERSWRDSCLEEGVMQQQP